MSTPPDLRLQGRRLQQPPGPMWRSRPGGLQFGKEKNPGAGASIAGEQGVLQQQEELEQSCCGSGEQGVLQQQEELAAGRDTSGTHL